MMAAAQQPSGLTGCRPFGDIETVEYVQAIVLRAKRFGLLEQWLDLFLGGLFVNGFVPTEAADRAAAELWF